MTEKIFVTDKGEIKINPLRKYKADLCGICDNAKVTDPCVCAYCWDFDMFWHTDQKTTDKLLAQTIKE